MKRFLALLAVLGGMVVVPVATAHADSTVTLSGVVRDGGAHGWPLWATVSVGDGSAQTAPGTGQDTLNVPAASTHDPHVRSPGYEDVTEQVTGSADVQLGVDADTCRAPGYRYATDGLIEGFDSGTTPAGWTIEDGIGQGWVWRFDDPGKVGNHT